MPTNPSALPTIPPFPALSDRAAGTYNSKAYTWATEWGATVAPALFTYATVTYNNAVEAATSAGTASTAAGTATTKAAEAVAAATAATSAPGTSGTSTSSLTLAVGDISFSTQTGKLWTPGMSGVLARTSDADRRAIGYVRTYNSGTGAVVFAATQVFGSGGPFTDWTFAHQGAPGIDATLLMLQWAPSTNSSVTTSRNGQLARPSATLTLTPDSAAALGDGFTMLVAPTSGVTTVAGLGTVNAGNVALLCSNGSANALLSFTGVTRTVVPAVGAASVSFTGLEAGFRYVLHMDGVYGSSAGADLLLRFSTNNGSSYLAADYGYGAVWGNSALANAAAIGVNSGASAIVLLGATLGATAPRLSATATDTASGRIELPNPANATNHKDVKASMAVRGDANAAVRSSTIQVVGHYTGATTAVNAFQLIASSGTLTGNFILEKIPRS